MTKIYIAGTNREITEDGNGRLDGLLLSSNHNDVADRVRILESYMYVQPWQTRNMSRFKGFMLDSGAFTFMQKGTADRVEVCNYLDRYAMYVRENGVGLFFELDVDDVLGVTETRRLRHRLESLVGRQCIPVWHDCRGMGAWYEMCDQYGYVAIGGIADKGRKSLEPVVPSMVRYAHDHGVKVHGLGYAKVSKLSRMGFDSVDSASWTWGVKGHYRFDWDGSKMHYNGFRRGVPVDRRELARHNFMEWVRMAEDLEAE